MSHLEDSNSFRIPLKVVGTVGIALTGLFVLIGAFRSAVEVKKGHVGVIMNWGAVQPKALEPGLHFITPFKQSIEEMNTPSSVTASWITDLGRWVGSPGNPGSWLHPLRYAQKNQAAGKTAK